jgi:hypothetical protein
MERAGSLQQINILWSKTMFEKARPGRDAFTFSLGGMRTITSFTAGPAIADDRINRIRDKRLERVRANRDWRPRLWFYRQRDAVQGT